MAALNQNLQGVHSIHKKVIRDATGRRLVLQGLLGRGAFGKVYRAEDEEAGSAFVVKMPLSEDELGTESPSPDLLMLLTRLMRESVEASRRLPAELQPGGLALLDVSGTPPMVLSEFYEDTFLERLHQGLSFADLCTSLAQVCEALESVHAAGQVHGNLSPGNILFAPPDPANPESGPRLKLADPLSSVALQSLRELESLRPGQVGWLPPELRTVTSLSRLNESADTWAIARLLYAAVVEPEVLKNASVGRGTLFAGPYDKQAIASFRDALAERLSRDNSNPHVRDILIRKASMLLTRALHAEAQPSPPKRFYSISELGARLLELKALFHPGFEQLGMILLDTGRGSSVYEEGEEIRFSLAFRCQGGLDDSDLIVCMTYVRDLETNQKVKDSGLVVLPAFDAGRFRFTFRIPTLSPGKYLIRVALAVKGSPGKPIPRDITIEVKPRPQGKRERSGAEKATNPELRPVQIPATLAQETDAPRAELALPPKLAEVLAKDLAKDASKDKGLLREAGRASRESEAELAHTASPDNVEKLLADLTSAEGALAAPGRGEERPSSRGRTTGPRGREVETVPDLRHPRDARPASSMDGPERRRGERPVLKADDKQRPVDRVELDLPSAPSAGDGSRAEAEQASPRLRPGALKLSENRSPSPSGAEVSSVGGPRPGTAAPESGKELVIARSRREREPSREGRSHRSAEGELALDRAPTQKVGPARDRGERPSRTELSGQDDSPARARVTDAGAVPGSERPRTLRSASPDGIPRDRGLLKSLRPSPPVRTGDADEWTADDLTPKEQRPGRSTQSREERHRAREERARVAGETTRKHLDRHPERAERPTRPDETPEERAERKREERRREELRRLEEHRPDERRNEDRRGEDRRGEDRRAEDPSRSASEARRRAEAPKPRAEEPRSRTENERPREGGGLREVLRRGKEALFDRDKGDRAERDRTERDQTPRDQTPRDQTPRDRAEDPNRRSSERKDSRREDRRDDRRDDLRQTGSEEAPRAKRSALARLLGAGRESSQDDLVESPKRIERQEVEKRDERPSPASLRTGERAPVERGQAERAASTSPERSTGERSPMERLMGERPAGERTLAERLMAERVQADRAQAERAQAERNLGERPQAERPQAERPPERSTGERAPVDRAAPLRSPGKPGERFIPEVYYPEARKTALPSDELEEYEQGGLKPHHELILIGVLLTTFIAIVGVIAYVLL